MLATENSPVQRFTCTRTFLISRARSTKHIIVSKPWSRRWRHTLMKTASPASPVAVSPSRWQMPIHPETYRDRRPFLIERRKHSWSNMPQPLPAS
jgi:hypothetical protein